MKKSSLKLIAKFCWRNWGSLLSIIAIALSGYATYLHNETYKVQNTPRLTAKSLGGVYVDHIQGREDEVVTVPVTVFNSSDAFAYDVILDLLFSDGTGRKVSLNDYLKSVRMPIIKKERLNKGEMWSLNFSPSAPNDARQMYLSSEKKFKIKLQLQWKDTKGKEYKFVEMAELTPSKSIEGISPQFWFESKASYNSVDDPKEITKHWGLGDGI
jgi:hypothetical protein